MRVSAFRRKWTYGTLITSAVAMVIATVMVKAANFGPVQYDRKNDQLIVTMMYEGTNPDHHFSVQWGRCRKHIDQLHEAARNIIELDILDDQGNDGAITSYTKVVKVSLAGLSCRPATVTLWTPPHFTTSIDVP